MTHATVLDVLIVYNGNLVVSASDASVSTNTPFQLGSTSNPAYAYFLSTCHKLGLKAGLSSSADIIGAGTCRSYWSYTNHAWVKNNFSCRAKQIFDKFSPKNETNIALRHLLFSNSRVRSFNSYSLFKLFFDKQKTYNTLSTYAIPTLTLTGTSLTSIKQSCTKLNQIIALHPHPLDFSQQVILKDRYGAGGRSIYKFSAGDYAGIQQILKSSPDLSFIIQPLIRFDHGFTYQGQFVSTDIRLIYLKGKVVSCYLRMAKSGDFRCNQHQGGSLAYLPESAIPLVVMEQSKKIATILNKQSSLFTLDFLRSNSGQAYLLEGNTGPGLNWDLNDQVDEREAKKLIRLIVKEIASRTNVDKIKSPRPSHHNHPAKNPFWPQASKTLSLALVP